MPVAGVVGDEFTSEAADGSAETESDATGVGNDFTSAEGGGGSATTTPEATGVGEELVAGAAGGGTSEPLAHNAPVTDGVNNCPYETGERAETHTTIGPVDPRIEFGKPVDSGQVVQEILFFNFGSGEATMKSADHLGSVIPIIDAFELDSAEPSHRIRRFEGFSDCVDTPDTNLGLRHERAEKAREQFKRNGALEENLGDALAGRFRTEPRDNQTREGRSRNRSVLIIVERLRRPTEEPTPPRTDCPFDDPCECPSDEWELFGISSTQAVVGVGIVTFEFILRNVKQDCCCGYNFEGLGGGFSAGVNISLSPTPASFHTAPHITLSFFQFAKAHIVDTGVTVGPAGTDKCVLVFDNLHTKEGEIDIGGISASRGPTKIPVSGFRADGSFGDTTNRKSPCA
jgi:hypothetical protein